MIDKKKPFYAPLSIDDYTEFNGGPCPHDDWTSRNLRSFTEFICLDCGEKAIVGDWHG